MYRPEINQWRATSIDAAPGARSGHSIVWTGQELIVWGGFSGSGYLRSGGRFNPGSQTWTATSATGAPAEREGHSAVWTGSRMIIWGGRNAEGPLGDCFLYDPVANSWEPVPRQRSACARSGHNAVWTGTENADPVRRDLLSTRSPSGSAFNPDAGMADRQHGRQSTGPGRASSVWTGTEVLVLEGAAALSLSAHWSGSIRSQLGISTASHEWKIFQRSAAFSLIHAPVVAVSSAPTGCDPKPRVGPSPTYPGCVKDVIQPQRGCGPDDTSVASGGRVATPLGLNDHLTRLPRVARSSQPWALGHSPFGAGKPARV